MYRLFSSPLLLGTRTAAIGGGLFGIGLSTKLLQRPVLLDSFYEMPTTKDKRAIVYEQPAHRPNTRLGGAIDYQQMSVGSFTGLLCGYVVGKVSRLLVFIATSGFLTWQFLVSRGMIAPFSALPLIGDTVHYLRRKFDVQELVTEKPSFKFSFAASFVVAALYA